MPHIHDFSIEVLGYYENSHRELTSYLHQIVVAGYRYDETWQKLATYPDNGELKEDSRYHLNAIQLDMSMVRSAINIKLRNIELGYAGYLRLYQEFARYIQEKANDLDFKLGKDLKEADH